MDKLQKFELMNKIVRELEDLQNSQNALITKIGQIEVDNMNGLNDSYLEKNLGDMHGKNRRECRFVSYVWEFYMATEIFAHFETQRDEYAQQNSGALPFIAAAEAAAAVEAAANRKRRVETRRKSTLFLLCAGFQPGVFYFSIVSMVVNSSALNRRLSRHVSESVSCSGLLAPISTEVMRGSFSSHARAICASV